MLLSSNYPEVSPVQFSYASGTLTVSWAADEADSYMVRYRLRGSSWQYAPNPPTNSLQLSGLTTGVGYQFEVKAIYGSYETLPRSAAFVIPSGTAGPTLATATAKSATTLSIAWTGPSTTYLVSWLSLSAAPDDIESIEVTGNTYTIEGLDPAQNYMVWVERYYLDEVLRSGVLEKDNCCVSASTPTPVVVEFTGNINGGYY